MADRRTTDAPPAARAYRTASGPDTQAIARPVDRGSQPAERDTASGSGRAGTTGPSRTPAGGAKPAPGQARGRGTRKAQLRVTHVDPWSVMKTAFLLSIAVGIVTVVSVAIVWYVLGAAGVWESINSTVQDVLGGESGSTFDVQNYIGASRVLGFTMIVAVVDVILITALATLAAFLYNLAAALLGGVEVTLAEDDR